MTSPLRLLLWLKWTLIWRGYRRNRMKVVGAIVMLIVFLPMSLGAAAGVWFLATLNPSLAPVVARDALAVVYLIWVITPLLGFQLNESYDLTKLFPYPVSYRQIFLGSVLGALLDLPVALTLPTFMVLLALFADSLGTGVLGALLLGLFLLHTLALGQAVTLALIGFLRSRRFRDITIVLFPLFGMAWYLGQRTFFWQMGHQSPRHLLDGPVWRVAGWLPPGWAASGLSAGARGDRLPTLLWLAGLALITFGTLRLAATTLKGLYLGDRGPLVARPGEAEPRQRTGQARGPAPTEAHDGRVGAAPRGRPALLGLARFVPTEIAAVAGKEFTYFTREPQYKVMALQAVYTLVVIVVSIWLPTSHGSPMRTLSFLGDWVLFGFSGTLLMAMSPLLFNQWAGEGAAITVLFSFPTPRRALLLGKNLAHGVLLLGLSVVGLTLVAGLTGRWGALPLALCGTVLAAPILLAAGNLVSIRFPHRMLVRGQRWSRGGTASAGDNNAGCAYALLYLLAYGATFIAVLPAAAAVLLPRILDASPLWYALSLPLALAYALTLYRVLLGQAESWLLAREPEIAQRIVPAD